MNFENAIDYQLSSKEIALITLNQPRRRNALTAQMWSDLLVTLDKAAADSNLRVLIITGAGEHFAAGADISEFSTLYATPESSADISLKISKALDAIAQFPLPTIAKIRGACVGGGAGIALACDFRFADRTSKFAITPARLGLVYPSLDVHRLAQAIGASNAKDMLFSARMVEAEDAKQMGLVNYLTEQSDLDQDVLDYALSLCATSKNSVRVMKQMFRTMAEGYQGETATAQQWFLDAFSSEDFKEGYQAFLEKRKPEF